MSSESPDEVSESSDDEVDELESLDSSTMRPAARTTTTTTTTTMYGYGNHDDGNGDLDFDAPIIANEALSGLADQELSTFDEDIARCAESAQVETQALSILEDDFNALNCNDNEMRR